MYSWLCISCDLIRKINSFISRIFAYDIAIFKCRSALMIVISSFRLYVISKSEVIFKFSHKIFRYFTKNNRCIKLSSTLSNFAFVIMSSTIHKHESIWFFINVVLNVKFAKTHDWDLLNNNNVISKFDISTSKFFVKNKIFNNDKFSFCLRFRRCNFVRQLL